MNPLQLFELFVDDEVVDYIVQHTNNYASADCNDSSFQTDYDEMRKFIGILFVTGYHTLPSINAFWSDSPSLGCDIIKSTMTRDRFKSIKKYIHVCDNRKLDVKDKFAKIAPLNHLMTKRFMQFGIFAHHLSIDEQMVAYFGRHSCKMFIKGKPIRFGFKYWDLCSSDGYLFSFIPYAGASANNDHTYGLGQNVVLKLLSNVTEPNKHTVTFDNFFTSHKLMCHLSLLGYFATGTVRINRTGNAKLTDTRKMKKNPRGSMDHCFDTNNEILAVQWNDNSVVTVLSNFVKHEPTQQAKRFDRKKKQMCSIPMPKTIYEYNCTMGGVDLFDNALNNYRIRMRGKKWYWPLFTNVIDAAMVNAWKLHCLCRKFENKQLMGQLEFRVFVSECLLRSSKVVVERAMSQNCVDNEGKASNELRKDRVDHTVIRGSSRRRCRHCKSQTYFECNKCKVGLHPKCFVEYHKK